jgi:uncharacterized membrane protein YfhO
LWQPNLPLLFGVEDVMGIYNPMLLADYKTYWESVGSRSSGAYDLLGAKYVVAKKEVVLDWAKFKPALTNTPKLNVYENTKALPKAVVVPNAEVMARDKMLERFKASAFEPTKTVFLESAIAGAPTGNGAASGTTSNFKRPNPNEITLQAHTDNTAYLVLNEAYYPGWKCYVDGQETAVVRADYAFQAVVLGPGTHQVRFVFEPRMFTIGWILSALAVVVCLVVLGLTVVRSRTSAQARVTATSEG